MQRIEGKLPTVHSYSGDALLLGLAAAIAIWLLWPHGALWAKSRNQPPAIKLRPIAWEAEKALPAPIESLSSLYEVEGDGNAFALHIEDGGQLASEGETAVLAWLEGEWVAVPLLATEEGYSAYFEGWLPDLVTVAALSTAIRRQ